MHEQEQAIRDEECRAAVVQAAQAEMPDRGGPMVWVATTASYERGQPRGHWVRVDQPRESLERAIAVASRDDDGNPAPWGAYAHTAFGRHAPKVRTTVSELLCCAELTRDELRAFHVWATLGHNEPAWLLRFDAHFLGRYDHLHDWLNLEIERAGWDRLIDRVLPSELRPHVEINLVSLEHDLLESGAILAMPDGERDGVFVFRGAHANE